MSERTTRAEDSLLLQRLVLAIVGAVNSRALYPDGHPRVREGADELVGALESLLIARHRHAINLLMLDDDLVVDQQPFRHAGLHLRGFLHAMRRLGVEGLTLGRGLDAEECARFLGAIAERGTAVSTEHVLVGRVKLAFEGEGKEGGDGKDAGDGKGSGGGTADGTAGNGGTAGAGAPVETGSRALARGGISDRQLESAREAFGRFRGDRKGSLAQMEALVWGFIDTLEQGARVAYPLAPLREHDELTYVHSVNVSLLVLTHARALGLHDEPLMKIGTGALLHDIGKLSLPGELLRKPGALTDEEWRLVRRHPELGAARLCELDPTTTVAALVAYEHHLRYDGEPNYPLLQRPRRPILASMLTSVADTFDAVQTVRPYARARTREVALQEVRGRAGTYLDPLLVESFCRLFEREQPPAPG
ncbi:MAG TPA: HD domain-containing phosphohydrolase [Thermoanaerobaculia bacterium]|jgi:hypothetical protein|nr:HD domain-containing phosphohydrolase [Thermoanaerobaculia bacterium]